MKLTSKSKYKPTYVTTTSGTTYCLGKRLMERVNRDSRRLMATSHFMTRYDLGVALISFRLRMPARVRVYADTQIMRQGDFTLGWGGIADGYLRIGCNRFSPANIRTMTRWANGEIL